MEATVDQCYVDKKYFHIQKKEVSLDNDLLLDHNICLDVMNIVMHVDSILANVYSSYFVGIKRLHDDLGVTVANVCVTAAK
ncbi:hypothetical protein Tco_1411421 [Tanacetum coccineum]